MLGHAESGCSVIPNGLFEREAGQHISDHQQARVSMWDASLKPGPRLQAAKTQLHRSVQHGCLPYAT